MTTNDQQLNGDTIGNPILDLQNLISSNINNFPSTTLLIFPNWYNFSLLNLVPLKVSSHEYDFLEYQDDNGNTLLRHTLGAI